MTAQWTTVAVAVVLGLVVALTAVVGVMSSTIVADGKGAHRMAIEEQLELQTERWPGWTSVTTTVRALQSGDNQVIVQAAWHFGPRWNVSLAVPDWVSAEQVLITIGESMRLFAYEQTRTRTAWSMLLSRELQREADRPF